MTEATTVKSGESSGQSEKDSGPSTTQVLSITGQLLAISVVMLPAVGVGIRLIYFSFDPRLSPLATLVALGASVQFLALQGFEATVPLYVFMFLMLAVESRRSHFLRPTPIQSRTKRVAFIVLVSAGIATLVIVLQGGVSFFVGLFFGVGLAQYAEWAARTRRTSWARGMARRPDHHGPCSCVRRYCTSQSAVVPTTSIRTVPLRRGRTGIDARRHDHDRSM